MKYEVTVSHRNVYVNGVYCHSIHTEKDYHSGGFRWVYRTPDNKILKMDYGGNSQYSPLYLYRQTEAEVKLYKVISSKDRRYFPKIFAHGTRGSRKLTWLIEENLKLDPNFKPNKEQAKIVRQLKNKYLIADIYPRARVSNYNWGATIRGRIVIWDFGCNEFNCGSELFS